MAIAGFGRGASQAPVGDDMSSGPGANPGVSGIGAAGAPLARIAAIAESGGRSVGAAALVRAGSGCVADAARPVGVPTGAGVVDSASSDRPAGAPVLATAAGADEAGGRRACTG